MNKIDAKKLLLSENWEERLIGARYYSKYGITSDRIFLNEILLNENVSWITKSIEKTLLEFDTENEDIPFEEINYKGEVDFELFSQINSIAVERTTGLLLHEIEPLSGRLRVSISKEIENFEESESKEILKDIDEVLNAIQKLSKAASSPNLEEFDVASLVNKLVNKYKNENTNIQIYGKNPLVIIGDSDLVKMIIDNGLRNAIEAVDAKKSINIKDNYIIISWGMTDKDNWISILDSGIGLPFGFQNPKDIGITNKKGHHGIGLAIANQSATSLEGKITLIPGKIGGAKFEFRWKK